MTTAETNQYVIMSKVSPKTTSAGGHGAPFRANDGRFGKQRALPAERRPLFSSHNTPLRPASALTLTPTRTRRVTFGRRRRRRMLLLSPGRDRAALKTNGRLDGRRRSGAGARETAAAAVGRRSNAEERKDVAETLGGIETAQVTSDATDRGGETDTMRWRPSPDSAPVNNANAAGTQRGGAQVD